MPIRTWTPFLVNLVEAAISKTLLMIGKTWKILSHWLCRKVPAWTKIDNNSWECSLQQKLSRQIVEVVVSYRQSFMTKWLVPIEHLSLQLCRQRCHSEQIWAKWTSLLNWLLKVALSRLKNKLYASRSSLSTIGLKTGPAMVLQVLKNKNLVKLKTSMIRTKM